MTKKQKQGISYFRFDAKLAQKLDRRIARQGFSSRGDFFTAVAYIALYGTETLNQPNKQEILQDVEKLPEAVTQWVKTTLSNLTEEQISRELHAVIREMLFAVVAMKGVDIAHENTWETVRDVFHERTGVWVTESDIREAFETFFVINRCSLDRYREEQLAKRDEF